MWLTKERERESTCVVRIMVVVVERGCRSGGGVSGGRF